MATAEGLVGAWLGVTARLNFRFLSCHIWTIQPGWLGHYQWALNPSCISSASGSLCNYADKTLMSWDLGYSKSKFQSYHIITIFVKILLKRDNDQAASPAAQTIGLWTQGGGEGTQSCWGWWWWWLTQSSKLLMFFSKLFPSDHIIIICNSCKSFSSSLRSDWSPFQIIIFVAIIGIFQARRKVVSLCPDVWLYLRQFCETCGKEPFQYMQTLTTTQELTTGTPLACARHSTNEVLFHRNCPSDSSASEI